MAVIPPFGVLLFNRQKIFNASFRLPKEVLKQVKIIIPRWHFQPDCIIQETKSN